MSLLDPRRSALPGALVLAAVAMLVAASCSSSSSKETTQTSVAAKTSAAASALFPSADLNKPEMVGTPVQGGSLTFGLESAVSTLVPGMIQQPSDFTVALALYDPIVGFDAQDKPAPTGLASKWTSSPDLKTWTFTLRPGATFTDGTPVNAQAVVTQVNAQKALPDCGCQADMAHITNVEAVDEHTVRFTLDQSNVSFPGLLAGNTGYLAAPAAWAAGAATMTSRPLGSGPFKVLTPGSLTLVRNPSYWRKSATGHSLPYLDKITFDPLADSTARIPSLRDGKVDILQTADTLNLVQAKKDPTLVVQPVTGSSSTIIVLNSHKAPFNDIRLRRAFNDALDREALNKGYYSDSRLAAYGPLEPSNPYYDAKGQLPHYDPAKARALVAQLKAEHKPTSFTSTCINTTEATSLEAIIKRLDAAAGMNLNIETIDQGTLVNRLIARNGDFQASCFRNSQVGDPDDLYTTYYRTGGQNVSMTTDLTIDQALRQGRKSTDFATRKAAYDIVQEQLAKDVTVVPLLFDLYGNVHTKNVSGLSRPVPNSLGLINPGDLYLVKS